MINLSDSQIEPVIWSCFAVLSKMDLLIWSICVKAVRIDEIFSKTVDMAYAYLIIYIACVVLSNKGCSVKMLKY